MLNNKIATEIANLLGKDYKDCKIQIINRRIDFVIIKFIELLKGSFSFKHVKRVLQGRVGGTYNDKLRTAQVYLFNTKQMNDSYQYYVLLHELRHFKQHSDGLLCKDDVEQLENDCFDFAFDYLEENWDSIQQLFK